MLMHWERLQALMAVVEHGGFSAAARTLGKTQSAVSQAVAQLEKSLGQAVVVRGEGGVRATQAGEILLRHAVRARDEMRVAEGEIEALEGLRGGRLTIATTDTLGCYFLPPALTRFRDLYPAVELSLAAAPSPRCAELVAQRKADLGVVTLPLPDWPPGPPGQPSTWQHGLTLLPLSPQPEALLVAKGHPLARKRRITLAEVADQPLLMLGRETASRVSLDSRFAALGLAVEPRMEANSVELLKTLVTLGFGVAVVPAMSASLAPDRRLVAIPLTPQDRDRWTGLVLPPHSLATHAARTFAELCQQSLGAQ